MVDALKTIILAAGEGTRLRPLTEEVPKSMVKIFGTTLLERQIDNFKKCMIEDITVVTGYKSNKININEIKCIKNKNYHKTNMVETLFCAKDKLEGNIIISYGDIIYEKNVLEKLIKDESDISVIIDKNWEYYWKMRFKNPLEDAESLVLDENNFIKNIGQPVKEIKEIQGQYIGLIKFQNKGTEILNKFYKKMKNKAKNGNNPLNSSIPFEKSYMTDLLQGIINEGNKVKAIPIKNGWLELDSMKDYNLYNEKLKNGTISELINLEKL